MEILKPEAFFNLDSYRFRDVFSGCRYVWEALAKISAFALEQALYSPISSLDCFGLPLPRTVLLWQGAIRRDGFKLLGGDVAKGKFRVQIDGKETSDAVVLYAGSVLMDDQIALGRGTVVEPGALIKGPTVIGEFTEVRQGAYVRGKCIVGDRCVVGHTTEMKGSIMLDDAKAGHFAYLGDSILGARANLGAGTKLANLKIGGQEVRIKVQGEILGTGLRKFGAVLGDDVEIGCNAVTNPGTLLGKSSVVFPLASVHAGIYEPGSIVRP